MKILLADDDPKIHLVVRMWFEKKGHDVTSVHNGKDALETLKDQEFDVLVSDVNMPLMNGIDLAKNILTSRLQPELIVLLTSRCDHVRLKDQFDSDKVHLYSKPFSPALLADLIDKLRAQQTTSS